MKGVLEFILVSHVNFIRIEFTHKFWEISQSKLRFKIQRHKLGNSSNNVKLQEFHYQLLTIESLYGRMRLYKSIKR